MRSARVQRWLIAIICACSWLALPPSTPLLTAQDGAADPTLPDDANGLGEGDLDDAESQAGESAEGALAADAEVRMPVRVIAGRLFTRCEISTRFRRIPANLLIDFDRNCAFELHNRAAFPLRVDDGGLPITLRFPGANLVLPGRSHGDEEAWEEYTKLYSKELGETACVGAIGSQIFRQYHVVLDLQAGFLYLSQSRPQSQQAPIAAEGSALTSVTLTNDLVWVPVRIDDGRIFSLSIDTTHYDSWIDRDLADELGHPAGDIGAVQLQQFDLDEFVSLRPTELVQVNEDGALGAIGLNFLERFRVEVDRVNRTVEFTQTAPAEKPEADLAFFRALVAEESQSLLDYLEKYPGTRLAREAAVLLLELQLDEGVPAADFATALEWIDKTRIEDLRATEALATMKTLIEAQRSDVAVMMGEIGVKSGRKDRYPDSVHRIHARLGELLLETDDLRKAWEHLLSAAFGLPEDGTIHLHLGEYYERSGRLNRAMSRFIQAVVAPESGPQAVKGLERVQAKLGGEPLSVDLVDRLVAGKVHNFTAATEFEETEKSTGSGRVVLAEFFTNPHFGRKQGEEWRSFAVAGAMANEGLLSHFQRDRLVVLTHQIPQPEAHALFNPYAEQMARYYGVNEPTQFKINGVETGPGAARSWRNAEEVYEANRGLVVKQLEKATPYRIEIESAVAAGRVHGHVTVHGPEAKNSADLRLQIVLVERGVLYPGKATVVVHRMLARAVLTDDLDGVTLALGEAGSMRHSFDTTLGAIEERNLKFLEEFEAAGRGIATRLSTRIDERQVAVVAYLRDLSTREVLQAGYWEPEAKEEQFDE